MPILAVLVVLTTTPYSSLVLTLAKNKAEKPREGIYSHMHHDIEYTWTTCPIARIGCFQRLGETITRNRVRSDTTHVTQVYN